jgi:tetratricopeptide (TPR) repeat protein
MCCRIYNITGAIKTGTLVNQLRRGGHKLVGVQLMKMLAFTFAICLAVQGVNPVWAETAFEQRVRNYHAGRYKHAVVFLSQAASLDPTNSLCHYYLANTLTKLNQVQEALLEYQICRRLEPTGKIATYCKQAVVALAGQDKQTEHLANSSGDIDASGITNSESSTARLSSHPDINRTMFVIRREVEYEKGKHKRQAEAGSKAAIALAERNVNQIKAQADADIQRAVSDSWSSVPMVQGNMVFNAYSFNPELARIRTAEIRRIAEEEQEKARRLGQRRVAEFAKLSSDKQKVLDEVAVNLKSQMEQPAGPFGVKLQPVGTDLYVRYYGHSGKSGTANGARPQGVNNRLELRGQRA